MADSIERLSFELTTAALAEQERAVSSLRMCAGTILGAASIAGSFLGAGVSGRSLDLWAVLATISFALCFASAIWVLVPRDLYLAFGGRQLMADGDRAQALDVSEGYRATCRWIEPQLELNRRALDRMAEWLTASCVLLAAEIVLWTISLTG
jgi:hypothetical protein